MEKPVIGDVLVAKFPFSDLSSYKKRPVLVIGYSDFDDLIVCQITSYSDKDLLCIPLKKSDFKMGSLPVNSFIRPDKIFTMDQKLVHAKAATLGKAKLTEVQKALKTIFKM